MNSQRVSLMKDSIRAGRPFLQRSGLSLDIPRSVGKYQLCETIEGDPSFSSAGILCKQRLKFSHKPNLIISRQEARAPTFPSKRSSWTLSCTVTLWCGCVANRGKVTRAFVPQSLIGGILAGRKPQQMTIIRELEQIYEVTTLARRLARWADKW